jgi:Telomere regulation protein Stn1
MASGPPNGQPIPTNPQLHFYPAYCHKASPTYFTWVKLTASDIHHGLRSRPGFVNHRHNISYQRQHSHNPTSLLFYLNHPIQFVCVVGIVVGLDDHERFWLFTVDDSSGATIDVTCRKPENVKGPNEDTSARPKRSVALAQDAAAEARKGKNQERNDATTDETDTRLEVLSRVDVGSVVKVKGTITTFRSVRQIALERLEIVPDTNAEVRFWTQRIQLFADVLSKPWVVSVDEQARLLEEAEGEVDDIKGRAARREKRLAKERTREKRHAEEIAKAYEVEEKGRERAAEEARADGLRLRTKAEKRKKKKRVVSKDLHSTGTSSPHSSSLK